MPSPSSETMCTSTEDCFCHEQVRQSPSPYSSYAQRITSSADIVSSCASLSLSMLTEQDLFQRVGAEPEPEGLQRDDLVGRDVAEIDLVPELLHEPRLGRLGRRLEDQLVEVDLVDDLVDQPRSHLTGGPEDACGAALAPLGDHLPCPRRELALDPLDPLLRRVDHLGVL